MGIIFGIKVIWCLLIKKNNMKLIITKVAPTLPHLVGQRALKKAPKMMVLFGLAGGHFEVYLLGKLLMDETNRTSSGYPTRYRGQRWS